MHAVLDAVFDRDSFLEIHPYYARNVHRGLRPARRLVHRGRGQPARPPRGGPRHRLLGQDRAPRAHLRRVQHPRRDLRGHAGLPAGGGPGALRRHPARGQGHLRLLRGHGAEDPDRHPQGHGRRVPRHELEADAERPGLRLAHRADRGDGRGRRRARPASAGARRRPRTRRPSSSASSRSTARPS